MAAQAIPEGHHTVTPYLVVRGAAKTIEFAKKAFGAQDLFEPMKRPDGTVMHAEFKVGDSVVMISDANDQMQPMQSMLHLYVSDIDAKYKSAISAGGKSVMEPMDQFYGDRTSGVKDPNGVMWYIATHKEDVAPLELKKRAETHMKQQEQQRKAS
ncbi:MAG: VOC family protein [Rhizomicrobium sp.]